MLVEVLVARGKYDVTCIEISGHDSRSVISYIDELMYCLVTSLQTQTILRWIRHSGGINQPLKVSFMRHYWLKVRSALDRIRPPEMEVH